MPTGGFQRVSGPSRRSRADARELARTPVSNPYRGQLLSPYDDDWPRPKSPTNAVASADVAAVDRHQQASPRLVDRPHQLPTAASAAAVLAITTGAVEAVLGPILLLIVTVQRSVPVDQSFHVGAEGAYVALGLMDLAVGTLLVIGGIALFNGRLGGRIAITVAAWTTLGMSAYWWLDSPAPGLIALIGAGLSIAILLLAYQAGVTRWLGVLPAAQPE